MSTEKKIRRFIKENAPQINDGGRFMEELSRQIDFLPQPSPAARRNADRREAVEKVMATARRLKRNNLAGAVSYAVAAALAIAVLLILYLSSPDISLAVRGHLEYVMAGFSLAVLGAALLSLRNERI